MFQAIKDAKDMIMIIIVGVLLIFSILTMQSCSHYKSKLGKVTQSLSLQEEINRTTEQMYLAKAKQLELDFKNKELKANEKYTEDIKTILIDANTNRSIVERVQHNTTETIKYLPNMERATLEEKFKTYAERLVTGSALLADIDRIAREYDAELELCRASYPSPTS